MRRAIVLLGVGVLSLPVAGGFALGGERPKAQAQPRALPSRRLVVFREREAVAEKQEVKSDKEDRNRELRNKLIMPIKFDGIDDTKTTLDEALDFLAQKYNLTFDINEEAFKTEAAKAAFKAAGIKTKGIEVANFFVADPSPVPEMRTNLKTVLQKILSRVPVPATFLVRGDAIEITTLEAIRKEFFADRPAMRGPMPPLVTDTFEKLPLEAALKMLNGYGNIVLDSRAAKQAQTTVSAELTNVPLDTAVRMFASMAELQVVSLDNALYVTSTDNARNLREEQKALAHQTDKPAKDQSEGKLLLSRYFLVFRDRDLPAGKPNTRGTKLNLNHELWQKIVAPIHFNGIDDPKVTLAEALDLLAKQYNLQFDINEEAFETAGVQAVLKAAFKAAHPEAPDPTADDLAVAKFLIADSAPIPEMRTSLESVLRKILSRVPVSTTFLIRRDMIEITTVEAIRKEFFTERPMMRGPLPPLVSVTFEKLPLETALKELNRSGNIVLDSRVAKQAQITVTAELANVPLDTAVRMLADMAGLKVVPLDNALYVTSKDNARILLEEQEKLRLQPQENKEKAKSEEKPPPPKTDKPAKAKP